MVSCYHRPPTCLLAAWLLNAFDPPPPRARPDTLTERYAEILFSVCRAASLRAVRPTLFLVHVVFQFRCERDIVGDGADGGGAFSRSMAAAALTLPMRELGTDMPDRLMGSGGQACRKTGRQRRRHHYARSPSFK